MSEALAFDATVYKVQTLVDCGLRVTLDLPEHEILAAALLMTFKRDGVALRVVARVDQPEKQESTGTIAKARNVAPRPKRKSQRTTAQGPDTSRSTE
jgi:hypothetical protein